MLTENAGLEEVTEAAERPGRQDEKIRISHSGQEFHREKAQRLTSNTLLCGFPPWNSVPSVVKLLCFRTLNPAF